MLGLMFLLAFGLYALLSLGVMKLITTPAQSVDGIADFLTSVFAKTELSLKAAV